MSVIKGKQFTPHDPIDHHTERESPAISSGKENYSHCDRKVCYESCQSQYEIIKVKFGLESTSDVVVKC